METRQSIAFIDNKMCSSISSELSFFLIIFLHDKLNNFQVIIFSTVLPVLSSMRIERNEIQEIENHEIKEEIESQTQPTNLLLDFLL